MDSPGKPAPAASPGHLEERWREMMDALQESPRDADLLVRAGQLAEEMGRKGEAYFYYQKAATIDPAKAFVVTRLRALAQTPEQQKEVAALARRPASFSRALDDVFIYPFRGSGLGILILGAVCVYGVGLVSHFNIFPIFAWILGWIALIYLSTFYVSVCTSTATGSEDLPEWPDFTNLKDMGLNWLKFAVAVVAAFPAWALVVVFLVWGLFTGGLDEGAAAVLKLLMILGLVMIPVSVAYLPMAVLANCIFGNPFTGFNYAFVFRSMFVAKGNYAICILVCFGTLLVVGVLQAVSRMPGIFVFSSLLATLVGMYGNVVMMRILGVFYRMNQAKLGWMTH